MTLFDPNRSNLQLDLSRPISAALPAWRAYCADTGGKAVRRSPRHTAYLFTRGALAGQFKAAGGYDTGRGEIAEGAGFRLRIEDANDSLRGSRLAQTFGYYCDSEGFGDTLQPVICRLPGGRGFLAGFTMGAGMAATLEIDTVWDDAEDAARRAHDFAERAAEDSRDAQREFDESEGEADSDDE